MKCFRQKCENEATVFPAITCKDKLGGNVMFAMAVPHCDEHTVGKVVDEMMTPTAWTGLQRLMRKEGLVPPEKATRLRFVPLKAFTPEQIGSLPEVTG